MLPEERSQNNVYYTTCREVGRFGGNISSVISLFNACSRSDCSVRNNRVAMSMVFLLNERYSTIYTSLDYAVSSDHLSINIDPSHLFCWILQCFSYIVLSIHCMRNCGKIPAHVGAPCNIGVCIQTVRCFTLAHHYNPNTRRK